MTSARHQLPEEERSLVDTVRRFVDREVRPAAAPLEAKDEYPAALVDQMKELGLFGLVVPVPYAVGAVSTRCFALVTEELARGWMSLAGAIGGHSVVAHLVARFGTSAQRERLLPAMATGECRAAMALTEPDGGSDLQALRTVARRDPAGGYRLHGSKTWITNAERAHVVAVLCKTDPEATPRHRGISILLAEKGPGMVVGRHLPKLGYRGIESCELAFDNLACSEESLLGGNEGEGFVQMMQGLELGRIQVAARAVGVARAALEDALAYARQRHTFGRPIWRHQSVGNLLADMATKLEAARRLTLHAAEVRDCGERCDLEAGMAKLFASEVAAEITLAAIRVHGAAGYSAEIDVNRYYRDAPLMIVGEGTNEIQRNVIVRQLVARSGGDDVG